MQGCLACVVEVLSVRQQWQQWGSPGQVRVRVSRVPACIAIPSQPRLLDLPLTRHAANSSSACCSAAAAAAATLFAASGAALLLRLGAVCPADNTAVLAALGSNMCLVGRDQRRGGASDQRKGADGWTTQREMDER